MTIIDEKLVEYESNIDGCERLIEKLMIIRSMFNEEIERYLKSVESNKNRNYARVKTLRSAKFIIDNEYDSSKDTWRDTVLLRDKFTCQKCGSIKNLTVHHIIPKARTKMFKWVASNGITLCDDCHKDWHFNHDVDTSTRVFFNWLSCP